MIKVFQNTATPDGVISMRKVAVVLGESKKNIIEMTKQLILDNKLKLIKTTTFIGGLAVFEKYEVILGMEYEVILGMEE